MVEVATLNEHLLTECDRSQPFGSPPPRGPPAAHIPFAPHQPQRESSVQREHSSCTRQGSTAAASTAGATGRDEGTAAPGTRQVIGASRPPCPPPREEDAIAPCHVRPLREEAAAEEEAVAAAAAAAAAEEAAAAAEDARE